MLTYWKCW